MALELQRVYDSERGLGEVGSLFTEVFIASAENAVAQGKVVLARRASSACRTALSARPRRSCSLPQPRGIRSTGVAPGNEAYCLCAGLCSMKSRTLRRVCRSRHATAGQRPQWGGCPHPFPRGVRAPKNPSWHPVMNGLANLLLAPLGVPEVDDLGRSRKLLFGPAPDPRRAIP